MARGSEARQFVPEEAKQGQKEGKLLEFPQAPKDNKATVSKADAVEMLAKIGWDAKHPEEFTQKVRELEDSLGSLDDEAKVALAELLSEAEYKRMEGIEEAKLPDVLKKVENIELLSNIGWDAKNPEKFIQKVRELEEALAKLGPLDDNAKVELAKLLSEAEYKRTEQLTPTEEQKIEAGIHEMKLEANVLDAKTNILPELDKKIEALKKKIGSSSGSAEQMLGDTKIREKLQEELRQLETRRENIISEIE